MRSHAKFGMSSMNRTLACAAWSRLSANLKPRPQTDYAKEGDQAHSFFHVMLTSPGPRTSPFVHVGLTITDVNVGAYEVTTAIAGAVVDALDYCWRIIDTHPDVTMYAEKYFPFPQGVVPAEDCGGWPDLVLISRSARRAWVIDYKHGVGETVEVDDNAQIYGYAACALWWEGLDRITGVILQPRTWRGDPVREVEISGADLVDFVGDVEDALRLQMDPLQPATPGDHCKWCPAALTCDARQAAALAVTPFNGPDDLEAAATVLPAPSDVPMDVVVKVLAGASLLRDWLKSYETYAYECENAVPGSVPGYKLVQTQAKRKLLGERKELVRQILTLAGGELEEDDVSPRQLLGVTEIEKKLVDLARLDAPKGEVKARVEAIKKAFAFITTKESSGNLTLVPISDPRPAYNRAAQAFEGVALPEAEPA